MPVLTVRARPCLCSISARFPSLWQQCVQAGSSTGFTVDRSARTYLRDRRDGDLYRDRVQGHQDRTGYRRQGPSRG
jgi:hypothetical protein